MRSVKRINIDNILFFDIETAPSWPSFADIPEHVLKEWVYKWKFRDNAPPMFCTSPPNIHGDTVTELNPTFSEWIENLWTKKAALYAEFSRVVCISAGYLYKGAFRLKTYMDINEGLMLKAFADDLEAFKTANKGLQLCGQNIKGFDIPFLSKRLIINRIEVPTLMDSYGLKPWEVTHVDTNEIWKMVTGESAPLPAIAMALGLPTPKDDIDGSEVGECFYRGEYDRIAVYCRKDVVTVANVFKGIRLEEPIRELNIELI